MNWAPIVFTSAVVPFGLEELLRAVVAAHENFHRTVDPAALRQVIDEETTIFPPPVVKNRVLELHGVKQTRTRPPTFVFEVNDLALLRTAYRNFLQNTLRKYFELDGTHIRLFFNQVEKRRSRGGKR
jgi:GTP-binding protein